MPYLFNLCQLLTVNMQDLFSFIWYISCVIVCLLVSPIFFYLLLHLVVMLFTVAFLSNIVILLLLGLALLWEQHIHSLVYKLSLGSVNILKNYTQRFDFISVQPLCLFVGE